MGNDCMLSLRSRLIYFCRNMNISSIFYFSKSTSINTQYSSLWDTLEMMLFLKYLIKWKRVGRISWNFRCWSNLKSSIELDIKRQMLYLSNASLNYLHKFTKKNGQHCVIEMTHTLPLFWLLTPLSCEITKIEKNAQLGVKSFNIKFTGHEIQFDPGFIPLSCEWTKIEKVPNWA